ncbi:MAG: class I SAM-dependent methyltransferase [Gammaproteobacteria bacterium]
MQTEYIKKAYRRYASVYDILFGRVLGPGRKRVVEALACAPGDRILEVGVGTGLSLPLYPQGVSVTGIDLSAEMLKQAQRRIDRHGLSQRVSLLEMNAERMGLADGVFDKVVAMYVVSVVSSPERLMQEIRRVCKPDGEIFVVNHFRARHPAARLIERAVAPLAGVVGFRPDLDLESFVSATGLQLLDSRRTNLLDGWQILRFQNRESQGREPCNIPTELSPLAHHE